MKPTKHQAIAAVTKKVTELKSCIASNSSAIKHGKDIEFLLDSILSGLTEESATMPKLKLVK